MCFSASNIDRLRDFIKHVYVDRRYTGERSVEKPPRAKVIYMCTLSFSSHYCDGCLINSPCLYKPSFLSYGASLSIMEMVQNLLNVHLPICREKLRISMEIAGETRIRVVHGVLLMMILLSVVMVIGLVLVEEVHHMIKTIDKVMIIKKVLSEK